MNQPSLSEAHHAGRTLVSYAWPDNVQAEAGWSTIKTKLVPHGSAFANLEEARLEVAYYLNTL